MLSYVKVRTSDQTIQRFVRASCRLPSQGALLHLGFDAAEEDVSTWKLEKLLQLTHPKDK